MVFPVLECASAEQALDMVNTNPAAISQGSRELLVALKAVRDAAVAEPA